MSARLVVLGVLLAAAASPSVARAGAWVPEPGHGYVKLWTKYLWGFSYIDGAGDSSRLGRYHELFVSTYGDVGVGPRLALYWHADLLRTFYLGDPSDGSVSRHAAPGDPQVGARLRLWRSERGSLAAALGVRAPFARGDVVAPVRAYRAPHDELGGLRVGSGVWELEGRVAFGYAFDAVYVAFSAGYQWRASSFDDRLLWSAEVGGSFARRWGWRARASGAHSLPTGDAPRAESPSGMGNGSSWAGLALELDRRLVREWYLGAVIEGGLFHLRRLSGGPVVSLAVSTQF
ncbi:MAG: hypothetical protein KF901_27845 [Myxococcales bacterium]|nr:hypothetical protein [Myxococcales bacterium]